MSNPIDWITENTSLKALNTFGIDAKARFFGEITSVKQLQILFSSPNWQQIPKLILGEGSNILLTQDFPGLVLRIKIRGIRLIEEDSSHVFIRAGGGENWHNFVIFCLENNYAGVENLSLIPGTVGAAPLQNIGAYGVEVTELFDRLTAIRIQDGEIVEFDHAACGFGYRESVFKNQLKNQYIIVSVTFKLLKKPVFRIDYGDLRKTLDNMQIETMDINSISQAVIKLRTEKLPDPKKIGNAGSFFKNPVVSIDHFQRLQNDFQHIPHYPSDFGVKIPAAWLIEQCRWKGHRTGAVGVHEKHALVLVNYGGGTGKEIQQLAKDIQLSVLDKFDIQLLPEVNIV